MRILLVLETAGAGSGRHVLDLARGLLQRGHEVDLVYAQVRGEKWFLDAIEALPGLRRMELAMRRAPHPSDLAACRALRRHLRRHGPFDVVHGHSSKGGAIARLAARGRSGAVVYTPHAFYTLDPTLSSWQRAFYGGAERLLAHLGDGIICVSHAEREHALGLGIPAQKLFLVPNRLAPLPPPRREWARAALGLQPTEVCIGFVGRLAPQKAVLRLVEAFARVARNSADARLAIVGTGPEEIAARRAVAEHRLHAEVRFVGHADGPALMAGFDIFALTSRYEAFPYVLLEAAARALPIVTMQVGGAEEVVREGVNGYVVPQDAPALLADRLVELCSDAGKRAELGRASPGMLGGGLAEMIEDTLAVYQTLLARRR